ncbi:TPA: putative 4-hydroxy-4-methyl-2-oxoglutarate aldolase [Photobacterium damselae]|uniref:putative 4-hydroxy-4-methyl-2-oxoglutarate aldolase n=1 Tax=Photobacterium damselae TaxID=38293 RepID=UPI002542ADF7
MDNDLLPDLCDAYEDKILWLPVTWQDYGGKSAFSGQIVTLRCFEDNSLVRDILSRPGKGKVLVIDGHGSVNRALLGDQLALLAVQNEWQGIVVYGAVRDVVTLSGLNLGVKALGVCPLKTLKRQSGEENVMLSFADCRIFPGDHLYADQNGIIVTPHPLPNIVEQ